jgi:hypothetical protein
MTNGPTDVSVRPDSVFFPGDIFGKHPIGGEYYSEKRD